MDLSVRNGQQHNVVTGAPVSNTGMDAAPHQNKSSGSGKVFESNKLIRVLYVILLAGIAGLLIAISFSFVFGPTNTESKYINTKDFQAVDISVGGSTTGDQIYFGNIKSLNSNYVVLNNVYYIPTSTTSSSNVTLEPLVCQIDKPFDQMVINRSSVNWWENLQPTSKVSTSIASYEKSNPKGPTCPTSSSTTTTTPVTTTKP
jgi:hypothetical protein